MRLVVALLGLVVALLRLVVALLRLVVALLRLVVTLLGLVVAGSKAAALTAHTGIQQGTLDRFSHIQTSLIFRVKNIASAGAEGTAGVILLNNDGGRV